MATVSNAQSPRNGRLDFRLPIDLKETIERAAALAGQTVSDFILGTTVPKAREVIRQAETIMLADRDRDLLLAALDRNDAKPNAAMLRAVEDYKATMV